MGMYYRKRLVMLGKAEPACNGFEAGSYGTSQTLYFSVHEADEIATKLPF